MFFSKNLSQFENIKHCFFSRKNGFSSGIYSSLNCGMGSDDNKDHVLKNLNYVKKKMNARLDNLILMKQTHSNKVILVDRHNQNQKNFDADALITNLKNFTIGVLTADCVPILLYDEINHIIGCIHAGWKGAKSGIIENTINKINEININTKIFASVGPCISADSYEVDISFYKNFMKESDKNDSFFLKKNDDKFQFDIRKYVINKLNGLGIENIDSIEVDTFKDSDNFFSYRRSQKLGEKDYGRCISTICLKT